MATVSRKPFMTAGKSCIFPPTSFRATRAQENCQTSERVQEKVCHGRIIFVLEGGYSIKGIRECGLRVLQELVDLPTLSPEKIRRMTPEKPDTVPELKKAMDLHRTFWQTIP